MRQPEFRTGGLYEPPSDSERIRNLLKQMQERQLLRPLLIMVGALVASLVLASMVPDLLKLVVYTGALVVLALQGRKLWALREKPELLTTDPEQLRPEVPAEAATERTAPLPVSQNVSVPAGILPDKNTPSFTVEAPPFYAKPLHWIVLPRKMRLPVMALLLVTTLSIIAPTPPTVTVGVAVLALASLTVYIAISGMEIKTDKGSHRLLPYKASKWQKVITFVVLASAVGLYAWSGEQILAEVTLIVACAYWSLVRYMRWRYNIWFFSTKMIKRSIKLPWYFGGSETESIPLHNVDAVSSEEPTWTKALGLKCGILTIKTKMQPEDDAFLQKIWPLRDHLEVEDFLNEQLLQRRARLEG